MIDGLYFDKTWVAEVGTVLNIQANDLTKPDTLNTTYSLSFQLPDSLIVRDLLENAEQLDSGSKHPYVPIPARLIDRGDVIFSGIAKLSSFQAGWKVNLVGAEKGLFDILQALSLRDLDFDRYNHKWNVAAINELAGKTEGVVYPVVDYGNYDSNTFAADAVFPAMYVHTAIRQMMKQAGYRIVGDWLEDDVIKRLAMPFVYDQPQAREQSWIDDRKARVTVAAPPIVRPQGINIILPFTVDNDGQWFDGAKDNFKPGLNAYQPDVAMRLKVQASQTFGVYISSGAIEAKLTVEVNGQPAKRSNGEIAQTYLSLSGPYNLSGTKTDTLVLDETIDCRANDQVRIRFQFGKRTVLADYQAVLIIEPEKTWASFTPDPHIYPNDTWLVAQNLPEMSCTDLLKTLALLTSSSYQVDTFKKTVELIRLDHVIARVNEAVDWSTKLEESTEPELNVTLDPYGQVNYLRWKQFDFPAELSPTKSNSTTTSSATPRPLQYGDGTITSNSANLPAFTELFELPFAACQLSTASITNYGSPLLIRTRRLTGSPPTLERTATTPRLILIDAQTIVQTQANETNPSGVTSKVSLKLTGCWWAPRPFAIIRPETAFALAFNKTPDMGREQTMAARYFQGLLRILRRPRAFSPSMQLEPIDIATLDLTRPIRLQKVRAGSLQISDSFFYLNKIANYTGNQPCVVTLIPFF
ncbi:hypothetical protein GCM10028807_32800 [Spirosoma daeguense]